MSKNPFEEPRYKLPVWPYWFIAGLAAIAGVACLVAWWPSGFPDEDGLIKISGEIERVTIRDDITKTAAGSGMPAIVSVYFAIAGVDQEVRYPSTHPRYPEVSGYVAVNLDVWVDPADIGKDGPLLAWRLEERNPYNLTLPPTVVSYDEIVAHVTRVDRSMVRLGWWLLGIALIFALVGALVRHLNKSRIPRSP